MKTSIELEHDLKEFGRGVLGIFFMEGTIKSCTRIAPIVMFALMEKGHTVASLFDSGIGHQTLAVKTTDEGWLHVDPTFMQFECQYQLDESEILEVEQLDTLFRYFEEGMKNPISVFEVTRISAKGLKPLTTYLDRQYVDYLKEREQRLMKTLNRARAGSTSVTSYAKYYVEWEQEHV